MLISKCKFTLLSVVAMGLCLLASVQAAILTGVDPTIINIGTGADVSYLVIDESTLYSTPLEFIYHYTYDSTHLISGTKLFSNVATLLSSNLSVNYNTNSSYGNYLTAISYGMTNVSTGTSATNLDDGTYWSYSDAGGTELRNSNPPMTAWQYANVGSDNRFISPGSWDGWTIGGYGDNATNNYSYFPSVAVLAVPEPSALPLIFFSLATCLAIWRWKFSIENN